MAVLAVFALGHGEFVGQLCTPYRAAWSHSSREAVVSY